MWSVDTRRRDVVIQKRLAIEVAKWVISSKETVSGVLNDVERERFFRLVERALDAENTKTCWQRFSKYVMTVFPDKESWGVVKARFYAERRKKRDRENPGRSIQVSEGVYKDLLTIKERKGVTFSEVVDMLLGYRDEAKEEH